MYKYCCQKATISHVWWVCHDLVLFACMKWKGQRVFYACMTALFLDFLCLYVSYSTVTDGELSAEDGIQRIMYTLSLVFHPRHRSVVATLTALFLDHRDQQSRGSSSSSAWLSDRWLAIEKRIPDRLKGTAGADRAVLFHFRKSLWF